MNPRKPDWLKVSIPSGHQYSKIKKIIDKNNLHTVCDEARCPNKAECWDHGTATFLILGDICTRNCRFCAVKTGKEGDYIDPLEPENLAKTITELGLKYVVITSVDRDDLEDAGAEHYAECIKKIKEKCGDVKIEVLIPDFNGNIKNLKKVVDEKPDVIAHNLETVKRLSPQIRDSKSSYEKSMTVLKNIKKIDPKIKTKTSLLLGMGEGKNEVIESMKDIREIDVDYIVLGQYLQPTTRQIQVIRYVEPSKFKEYEEMAYEMGFKGVVSSPLARTSYHAHELF